MSYKLEKPYTDTQRADFIVEYNRKNGLRIEETDKNLFALEPNEIIVDGEPVINPDYEQEHFEAVKALKLKENDEKVNIALVHTFTIEVGENKTPCEFIYNEKTERNLNSSAIGFLAGQYEAKQWTDEQGITVNLTAEDVAAVLLTFNDFANDLWEKWGDYHTQINACTTAEEVEAIVINYGDEEAEETETVEKEPQEEETNEENSEVEEDLSNKENIDDSEEKTTQENLAVEEPETEN